MESAKVMIVEDERIVAKDIRNRLISFGYVVTATVSSGEEAVKKVGETRPDLVLMDILLKREMDGVEAAEQIRARFNIPVIYLTAYADEKTLQRAKITEPFGYIIKPFEERELRTTIEIALYRHKMERRVRESEKRYRDLFDSSIDGVYWTDSEGFFTLINKAGAAMFGHSSADEVIGKPAADYWYNASDRDAYIEELRRKKSGSAYLVRGRRCTGEIVHVEVSARILEDEDGNYIGTEGILRDVTERKQAEKALAEEKKISDAVIESLPGIFYLSDEHGKFLRWNRNLEQVTGYSSEEISRMAPLEFFIGEDRRIDEEHIQRVFQKGKSTSEANLVTKDGRRVLFFFTCEMIMIGASKCAVGVGLDITERKKAEEALRKSEESYRNLVETMSEGLGVQDKNGLITFMNKRGCEMLGYELEELIGKPTTLVFDEKNQEILREQMAQRREGKRQSYEIAWTRKDGGKIFTIIAPRPFFDERGNFEGSVAVFTDITERKTIEEQIFRISRDWEDTFNSITDMITVHDKDFNIVHANKAAEKILGLPFLEKTPDAKCFRYYHGSEKPPEGCPSCGCLQTGVAATFELFEPHLNMFIEIQAIPRFDSNNQLIGLIHVVRDITERKRSEEALRESEEKFRNLFENANDGIFILSMEGNFIDVNRTAYERLGYTKDEMLSMSVKEMDTPEFASRVPERLAQIQKHGYAIFESAHHRKDGTIMPVEVNSRILSYRGQKVYFSVIRDITDRKEVEEKLNLLFEEVSKAKTEWELTFDSVAEIIALVDAELNIIRCNKSFADFCGMPLKTIPGHKLFDLFPWSPADMEYFRDKVQKEEPTEWIEIKTATGRWFYLSHRPIADRKGDFLYSVIIATDITSLKSAQEKIHESEETLKERVKELERFYEMAVGRELKMKELKKEIEKLKAELGKYKS